MKGPEHVYPAVLLLQTVPSDMSGVMVTQDVDTGDPSVLSVAVNEGVGGAVDGQAAESVRIDREDGDVRLLATATAPRRHGAAGHGRHRAAARSGTETLLTPDEIGQLVAFADETAEEFPHLGDGRASPSRRTWSSPSWTASSGCCRSGRSTRAAARSAAYLIQMDKALDRNLDTTREHAAR